MSVYETVTNRIVEELERGTVPWVKPWKTTLPYNAVSQRAYSGVNILLLWYTAYGQPAWLTFKQARLGGYVKKEEKSTHIVYASTYTKKGVDASGGETEEEIPFLKWYSVFNIEQCEGLPERLYQRPAPTIDASYEQVERFIADIGASIKHGGSVACFVPSLDLIRLPNADDFEGPEHYFAISLHEHGHWSGHPARRPSLLPRAKQRKRRSIYGLSRERRHAMYENRLSQGSILSFPDRGPWGNAWYRGNCSGYVYKQLFEWLRPRVFTDPMVGSGTSVEVAREMDIEPYGLDLHSGFNILKHSILEVVGKPSDLVLSHPPYHNMITYSGCVWGGEPHPGDLSRCATEEDFLEKLRLAVVNQRKATRTGGFYGIIIGDVRRGGRYFSPQAEIVARMPRDELRSVLIKAQHNVGSNQVRYAPMKFPKIAHEYVVLWQRPPTIG